MSFSILISAGLQVMDSCRLSLSWKVFVCPSILKDSSAGYSNLGWLLFAFRAWDMLFQALLDI